MKKLFIATILLTSLVGYSQVFTNGGVSAPLGSTNYFLDASTFEGFSASTGKLLGFPRVDLTSFAFNTQIADDEVVLSYFDGAVVYNNTAGSTGTNAATQGQVVSVVPGFYYFSNPGNPGNVTNGRWIPMGSAANNVVKSKTVTVTVPANATEAKLALGTGTILGGEVVTFLGAKIYDSTGENLIMTADSAYNKVNNDLTTGNGLMFQVLGQGTYQVVVEYK